MFLNKPGFDITESLFCFLLTSLDKIHLWISFFFLQIWDESSGLYFCLILIFFFFHSHKAHQNKRTQSEKKSFIFCLCGFSGVTLLLSITDVRRTVTLILPGRGSEPCRGRKRVWSGGVPQALVTPTWRRGGRHWCGCCRNRILGGCCEETCVFSVLWSSYCTKVHLIGTTQERTTWWRSTGINHSFSLS